MTSIAASAFSKTFLISHLNIARHFNCHGIQWFIIQVSCLRGKAHFPLTFHCFPLLVHCNDARSACSLRLWSHVALRLFLCLNPVFVLSLAPLALSFACASTSCASPYSACWLAAPFIAHCLAPFVVFIPRVSCFLLVMIKPTTLFKWHRNLFSKLLVGCNATFMTYTFKPLPSLCCFWYRKYDGFADHYKRCPWMKMKDLSKKVANYNQQYHSLL